MKDADTRKRNLRKAVPIANLFDFAATLYHSKATDSGQTNLRLEWAKVGATGLCRRQSDAPAAQRRAEVQRAKRRELALNGAGLARVML